LDRVAHTVEVVQLEVLDAAGTPHAFSGLPGMAGLALSFPTIQSSCIFTKHGKGLDLTTRGAFLHLP
jgi:hypothetical protein